MKGRISGGKSMKNRGHGTCKSSMAVTAQMRTLSRTRVGQGTAPGQGRIRAQSVVAETDVLFTSSYNRA